MTIIHRAQWPKSTVGFAVNLRKNSRRLADDDPIVFPIHFGGKTFPGKGFFGKLQLHKDTIFRIFLFALVIGVKDKIAQGIENILLPYPFPILNHMGMVGNNHIGAHVQIFQI